MSSVSRGFSSLDIPLLQDVETAEDNSVFENNGTLQDSNIASQLTGGGRRAQATNNLLLEKRVNIMKTNLDSCPLGDSSIPTMPPPMKNGIAFQDPPRIAEEMSGRVRVRYTPQPLVPDAAHDATPLRGVNEQPVLPAASIDSRDPKALELLFQAMQALTEVCSYPTYDVPVGNEIKQEIAVDSACYLEACYRKNVMDTLCTAIQQMADRYGAVGISKQMYESSLLEQFQKDTTSLWTIRTRINILPKDALVLLQRVLQESVKRDSHLLKSMKMNTITENRFLLPETASLLNHFIEARKAALWDHSFPQRLPELSEKAKAFIAKEIQLVRK